MPIVDVLFTPGELVFAGDSIVVIIDVLRASSTLLSALQNGCAGVIPASSIQEAQKIASGFDRKNVLLAGERKAIKPSYFDLGNSPLEFTSEVVKNKIIVLTTSNGTRLVKSLDQPSEVIACAILNVKAVTHYFNKKQKNVLLYCAGSDKKFSLEDAFCASLILQGLVGFSFSDGASWLLKSASCNWGSLKKMTHRSVLNIISQSQHAMRLKELGLAADVNYCAQINTIDLVPILRNGKFIK